MTDQRPQHPTRLLDDIAACLRFATRLPVPTGGDEDPHRAPRFETAARAMPVVGLVIGSIVGALILAAGAAQTPPHAIALLALALAALVTGALHEDGLADLADGFGGGRTRERKLEIMKDSRVGTFGVLALVLVVGLQAASLGEVIARHGALAGACVFLIAATVSRAAMLWPMMRLPAARPEGASASVGRPTQAGVATAAAIATLAAGVLLLPWAGIAATLTALGAAGIAAVVMTALAARHIGGQTGDVIGATQLLCQTTVLVALAGRLG